MKVIEWAQARKIIPNSTPVAQARKTLEEAGELLEAAARLDAGDQTAIAAYRDAVGDVVVTLVNGCALADVDLVDCFYGSFQEIKDRRGTLMPNGLFLKENDHLFSADAAIKAFRHVEVKP